MISRDDRWSAAKLGATASPVGFVPLCARACAMANGDKTSSLKQKQRDLHLGLKQKLLFWCNLTENDLLFLPRRVSPGLCDRERGRSSARALKGSGLFLISHGSLIYNHPLPDFFNSPGRRVRMQHQLAKSQKYSPLASRRVLKATPVHPYSLLNMPGKENKPDTLYNF